jgi:hypothetical protein
MTWRLGSFEPFSEEIGVDTFDPNASRDRQLLQEFLGRHVANGRSREAFGSKVSTPISSENGSKLPSLQVMMERTPKGDEKVRRVYGA